MAKRFAQIEETHRAFISRQHLFFTATAGNGTRVNISPRSTNCFRVLGPNTVAYLDRTGSGNETAAHIHADGRLTIMFCSFEQSPLIMRLYGRGLVVRRGLAEYSRVLESGFDGIEPLGTRQIIKMEIDLVQTSCGYGVPFFEYQGERPAIDRWAEAKGAAGLEAYQREENLVSMDGLPTGLFEKL
jgi:pyridoxamine 5'-phosphate oxidase-like protein